MDVTELFDDPRLTAMGLLFEAYGGVVAKLEPVWQAHGLSGLDLNALMRLSRSSGRRLRMSELAVQTALSTSGVTRLVDRLARAGLVERELDTADRRSAYA
ncbi:MarR family winged helix-turn-helix transcriptional regulator, partial [Nocardia abscessus]